MKAANIDNPENKKNTKLSNVIDIPTPILDLAQSALPSYLLLQGGLPYSLKDHLFFLHDTQSA
jgi:hypothetical protein